MGTGMQWGRPAETVRKRGPADGVTRAVQHRYLGVGEELPVRVPDRRLGNDVIGKRREDREAGERSGLSGWVRAPCVEVGEVISPLVLQPARAWGVGTLRMPLDPMGRAVG